MDIVTHFPQNNLLQPYIDRYYFLKTTDASFSSRYYVFPSMITPLNIHKNVDVQIGGHHIAVSGSAANNYQLILQGMRKKPLSVVLSGALDKITILFKPLGLNHFIKNPFSQVAGKSSQVFTEWEHEEGFEAFLSAFYATDDNDTRISILEKFLLGFFAPVKNFSAFGTAVQQLADFEEEKSISDITAGLGISGRTFDRHFKLLTGITPAGFRKIARFRHSLNNKVLNERFTSLTELGYESNFYDQAYFINIYKEITGLNPGTFFKKISTHTEAGLFFQYY